TRRRRAIGFATVVALLAIAGAWIALPDPASQHERIGKDGAPADLVPAGPFVRGDDEYVPRREVFVDAFYIDRFEVTVGRFARFLRETGSLRPPAEWEEADLARAAELPVAGVD